MKRQFIFVLVLLNLLSFNLFACEKNFEILEKIEHSLSSEYYIIDSAFGNFISKDYLSVLVFCDFNKNKNTNIRKQVRKIFVYKIINNHANYVQELETECCYYDKGVNALYESLRINLDMSLLGEGHSFGWTGDFNNNGIDEIMLIKSSKTEEGPTLEFWEFQNSTFVKILPELDAISYIKKIDKEKQSMELSCSKYSELLDDYEIKKIEIHWDSKLNKYLEHQIK